MLFLKQRLMCVLHVAGITMYAVGVGKAVEDELREIASEPMEKHFFYSADFTAISQIAENLKLNVCAGAFERLLYTGIICVKMAHSILFNSAI